ncbi:hypothetical protein DPMN_131546 [Dreissena polymorpha]|uniref:Uncharacterized protein n=1 Tax=Dreissena polymorpha TaxID=45954 RepID=A0A9D4K061_DREPO|nr:hypothetical protein DPMN_131546 [Dreissena polymorpha]
MSEVSPTLPVTSLTFKRSSKWHLMTSSSTSMTLLGRPATWHVCRAHRDPPNDVGPVVIGRHMDVPLTS